ncbi:RNA polymerase sigma factor [Sorangium sp. So ce131]|uniref:RNA polymerase sigma factor n=1 Tax=Sorangium sp. So ce131 TaxID=3133282 RepID=UPI003F5E8DA4
MGKKSRKNDEASEQHAITPEEIIAKHRDVIRWVVEQQGFQGADRDDLVQEIFWSAARSLPRFDPRRGTLRAWLMSIAFHVMSHERHRAYRRYEEPWPEEALDGLASRMPDSETRLIAEQRCEVLAGLLQEVPQNRREILVAHDLKEEAIETIAEERGMPPNTAWNHLRLARQSLKEALRRWQARHRGRGLLLAPLAAVFAAAEARASGGPLRRGLLRRAADHIGGGLRCAAGPGAARPAASAWRASPARPRPLGRATASTAAGAMAGALMLLAPGPDGVLPTPPDHATAPRSPQVLAAVRRDQDLPSLPELPLDPPVAVAAGGAPKATEHDPSSPRHAPGPLQGGGARSGLELQLWRQVMAARTSGRGDMRLLLEQHRREFPRGAYAGERDELLRRTSVAARPE